jgi:uncharacterized beta-barrel protein YwiB (DUF1934 family)
MVKTVTLSIRGLQSYPGQDPDVIELVTEGTFEAISDGWKLCYEESDLTGLAGVCTTFQIQGETVTLIRSGKLNSKMVFQKGIPHDSLYQMEFGALMLTVCATHVETNLTHDGGTIDLKYSIEVEQNDAGIIDYHLDIKTK